MGKIPNNESDKPDFIRLLWCEGLLSIFHLTALIPKLSLLPTRDGGAKTYPLTFCKNIFFLTQRISYPPSYKLILT